MEAFSDLLGLFDGIPLTKTSDAEIWCFRWQSLKLEQIYTYETS